MRPIKAREQLIIPDTGACRFPLMPVRFKFSLVDHSDSQRQKSCCSSERQARQTRAQLSPLPR